MATIGIRRRTQPISNLAYAVRLLLCCFAGVWLLVSIKFVLLNMTTTTTTTTNSDNHHHSSSSLVGESRNNPKDDDPPLHKNNTIVLSLHISQDQQPDIQIRMNLFQKETPDAARYIQEGMEHHEFQPDTCTIYRGEPVPPYWGSLDKPDRFFDGGRWGPPYALVQGAFLYSNNKEHVHHASPESHRPMIQRGMVAWAGGKGGPHFFIALADHPEWGTSHTVFAEVVPDDMELVDSLLTLPLQVVKRKTPPHISNFVKPIPFTVQKLD